MIHPTRTDLLQLEEKATSIANSVAILKARRQALIRGFLESVRPLVRSRDAIRRDYGIAIDELHLSEGHEGAAFVETLAALSEREVGVDIAERNLLGVRYRELVAFGPFVRMPPERAYDYTVTTPHLEEAVHRFESVLETVLEIAAFESKLKMLGEEILAVTRRVRVLEERVLPRLRTEIRSIVQFLGEREREAHYRLKKFKSDRRGGAFSVPPSRTCPPVRRAPARGLASLPPPAPWSGA
ncbi:MAG: V-type ATP synthase subunit D [Gammaproteobacteria bacterium]|nr:V-type ATP synthase subunit D [Gammaproteobacteria bacterium]MDH5272871.1 V-type ATP synthase subunit D [Gammaproteobacteria bacterium]